MSSVSTALGQYLADAATSLVYVREAWTDEWELVPYLWCDQFDFAAGPNIPQAALTYFYGQILQPDSLTFAAFDPLELVNRWVKIEVPQPNDAENNPRDPIVWYGRIAERAREISGVLRDRLTVGGSLITSPSGIAQFTAFGLIHELDRAYVSTSIVETDSGEERVGRAIAFNRGKGYKSETDFHVLPNASESNGDRDTRIFAKTLKDATTWTAVDIIKYLLAYHTPTDQVGSLEIDWALDDVDSQYEFATWFKMPLEVHGQTVKQVLDTLVDRRRLTGYDVRVYPGTEPDDAELVKLHLFTFSPAGITLWNGDSLPGNTDTVALDFDDATDIAQALTVLSYEHAIDQVELIGARRGSVFTLSTKDQTLEKDWTDEQETAYEEGASGETGYGDLDRAERQMRNDLVRIEPRLTRVFRWFRLKEEWDGLVNDGTYSAGDTYTVHPKIPDDGTDPDDFDEPLPFWQAGLRFENYLPLKTDHDYTENKLAENAVEDNTPPGSEAEYLRPIVLFRVADRRDESDDPIEEYIEIGQMCATVRFEQSFDGGRGWSAGVRMQERAPGLIVDVSISGGQHTIGKDTFTPLPESDVSEYPTDLDYRDNLIATVFVQFDDYLRVVYPPLEDVEDTDMVRVQRIECGDDFALYYAPPKTIVGLKEGGKLERTDSGGWVRDDRPKLRTLAQVAWEWYSRPRRAFSLVYRQALQLVKVGQLITSIGATETAPEEINGVATRIVYNLLDQTTSITTDYGQLDVTAFVRPKTEWEGGV